MAQQKKRLKQEREGKDKAEELIRELYERVNSQQR
jgi:hypothetical protein